MVTVFKMDLKKFLEAMCKECCFPHDSELKEVREKFMHCTEINCWVLYYEKEITSGK